MADGDPFDRTWIETKILMTLNASTHPIPFSDLGLAIPSQEGFLVLTVDRMKKEGLLTMYKPSPRNSDFVAITAMGRAVLFHIMTAGRSDCG
jgi:hypothetical protein